jgi:hypothetical protein
LLRALDLHVLGLPPAFALSQDQTLKLDENFIPASHNVFDEVPPLIPQMIAHLRGIGVDLKRRPPKSLPTASLEELLLHEKAARKDSAVHVSLSSYSLVKQPGTWRSLSPVRRGAVETPKASDTYRRPFHYDQ